MIAPDIGSMKLVITIKTGLPLLLHCIHRHGDVRRGWAYESVRSTALSDLIITDFRLPPVKGEAK